MVYVEVLSRAVGSLSSTLLESKVNKSAHQTWWNNKACDVKRKVSAQDWKGKVPNLCTESILRPIIIIIWSFVLAYVPPSLTLERLFSTPLFPAHFLCLPLLCLAYQTRHSHTHGDGWAWPGHSVRLRGVPVHECAAAVSRAAGLVGLQWVNPWPKGGRVTAGCRESCLVYSRSLRKTSWYTGGEKSWHMLTNLHWTHCDDAGTRSNLEWAAKAQSPA